MYVFAVFVGSLSIKLPCTKIDLQNLSVTEGLVVLIARCLYFSISLIIL